MSREESGGMMMTYAEHSAILARVTAQAENLRQQKITLLHQVNNAKQLIEQQDAMITRQCQIIDYLEGLIDQVDDLRAAREAAAE
jgi:hypothetical protein